ncbi:hypothetical protein NECID01_0090 [Nematocida sp. AWRm77]|nr:hypothetical protein NECID01_0090 [Nematocida sp. AWRm77]
MEKYSNFSDPVTGLNPYIREIRKTVEVLDLATSLLLFQIAYYLPFFVYCLLRESFVTIAQSELTKAKQMPKGVLACTYTSVLDSFVLHKLFCKPNVFVVTPTKVFSLSKYNVHREVSRSVLEHSMKDQAKTTVLFLSGGVTNSTLLLDVAQDAKKHSVKQFLSIGYTPSTCYDIQLLGRRPLLRFSGICEALAYYFFYYTTISTKPNVSIATAETLQELSRKTNTEISNGMDMRTTERFVKTFS